MKFPHTRDEFLGGSIHYTAILLSATLILYSTYIILRDGLYSYIYPAGWDRALIHSSSLLSISASFLTIYLMMKYLYPLARTIITMVFTIFSIHLYDFMWSLQSQKQRGYGISWVALISIVITLILIERFDNKHGMLNKTTNRFMLVGSLMFVWYLCFGMMYYSRFWKIMALYDLGLGPDPNIGNIWWLLGKVLTFWLPLPLIAQRDYSVPLELDPRVLVW